MPTKTAKGTVALWDNNGRLWARWRWQGKRFTLGLGVPDTPTNRKAVAGRIHQIERDIAYNEFDPTLERFKLKQHEQPKVGMALSLWLEYVNYRSPMVAVNTGIKSYAQVTSALKACPILPWTEGLAIRDWLIAHLPPASAKRVLVQLNACGKWAVQSGRVDANTFQDLAKTVSIPKSEKVSDDIDPFTPDERKAILEALQNSIYYKSYAALVKFLFLTGCRPGEALALEWGDIHDQFIHFQRCSVIGQHGLIKNGLKTQSSRKLPINRQLQDLFDGIPRKHDLVFTSPRGRLIDWTNFRSRAWASTLKAAGVRFRKPYQTRHTFITEMLRLGMAVQDVAKLVGNSPEIIYRHYAGSNRSLVVPEID